MIRLDWPGPPADGPRLIAAAHALLAEYGLAPAADLEVYAGAAAFAIDGAALPVRLYPAGEPADAIFDNRVALVLAATPQGVAPDGLMRRGARLGLALETIQAAARHMARLGADPEAEEAVLLPVLARGLVVEVSASLYARIVRPAGPDGWTRAINALRHRLFAALGIPLPAVECRPVDALQADTLRLRMNAISTPPRRAGGNAPDDLLEALYPDLMALADLLLTPALSEALLRRFDGDFPMLLINTLERHGIAPVVAALRLLVAERVCVHNLRNIFDSWIGVGRVSVADWNRQTLIASDGAPICPPADPTDTPDTPLTPRHLAGTARIALRAQLIAQAAPQGVLQCVRLTHQAADRLRTQPDWTPLEQGLLAASAVHGRVPALLAPPDLRTTASERLRIAFPDLNVLSKLEISPQLKLDVIREI